jgi:hypothetical protein
MADSKPMPPISVKKSRSTNPADEDMVDIEHASLAATTKYLEELLEKKNADGRHVAACKSTPLGGLHGAESTSYSVATSRRSLMDLIYRSACAFLNSERWPKPLLSPSSQLRFAHPVLRLKQQQLSSKDGNGTYSSVISPVSGDFE